jgi:hypothetical protein
LTADLSVALCVTRPPSHRAHTRLSPTGVLLDTPESDLLLGHLTDDSGVECATCGLALDAYQVKETAVATPDDYFERVLEPRIEALSLTQAQTLLTDIVRSIRAHYSDTAEQAGETIRHLSRVCLDPIADLEAAQYEEPPHDLQERP